MLDYTDFNFDLDGDGILDCFAEGADLDGDGVLDSVLVDSDNNGVMDTVIQQMNLSGNGIADTVQIGMDTDIDGVIDTYTTLYDANENGVYEQIVNQYDMDIDGIIDTTESFFDFNEDGFTDASAVGQLIDTDGDRILDTYMQSIDENGDNLFETVEVYDYDAMTGAIELESIYGEYEESSGGLYIDDLENFDPNSVEADEIIGDPEAAMDQWEYQGDTNRCAVYSQKFIIEEFTGEELDIEELADLAEENGWFTEEGGTPLINMGKILDHYGIENEMSFDNDIEDLKECLENGGKAIVSIDADEIWYGENDNIYTPDDGPNHAVEVIGIDNSDPDNPMVILNDSGNPDGCGEMIPMDVFIDAWDDGGNQMITCM